jgi:membrane dipeptidase
MPAALNNQLRAGYKVIHVFRDRTDTDGYDTPLKMFNLTDVLALRGHGDGGIGLILGANVRRLLAEIWR